MTYAGKERLYRIVIVVLLLVIAAMAYKFIVAGSTAAGADGRTAVLLEPGERAFVLREMRGFLVGLQRMTDALTRDDMQAVAQVARELGTQKGHDAPVSLMGKLPLEFKKLAFGVHGDFDAIAAEAGGGGQSKRTLAQISAVLQKCTACHEQYQFDAARQGPQAP
ncbi:MAG TPA: hypothetical protein VFM98_10860 [Ramlibacter sp.]|uniref:hypothetical protein n=1 Tax=Ramlibacter sp. TaxID=1917967 RepID=UPI002D806C07|nr:hypothetical protein [Ramlibacter sp.]HET8746095.1 hypothetical protein [Ramlibacter sp.]